MVSERRISPGNQRIGVSWKTAWCETGGSTYRIRPLWKAHTEATGMVFPTAAWFVREIDWNLGPLDVQWDRDVSLPELPGKAQAPPRPQTRLGEGQYISVKK